MTAKGLLIAATSSRSGKTMLTAGLARAIKRSGREIYLAKSGPDYIDPGFHKAASGHSCVNLDGWAMSDARLHSLLPNEGLFIVEGAMGLFDGTVAGAGSCAEIAKRLKIPVVLVVNCASMSQSVGAVVNGFIRHDPDLSFAGLVLNQVGSERHEKLLRAALEAIELPILGVVRRTPSLARPSRHLGLVQAEEDDRLDKFLERAADVIEASVDIDRLVGSASNLPKAGSCKRIPPLGERIAIARDQAFTFIYPHLLDDWTSQGAQISYFSPLADEPPSPHADAIYLPGGYPELFAAKLTRAGDFKRAMTAAARSGRNIYGECGGYMVLGNSITDARNVPYGMLGLLDLETSFFERKLHLSYLNLQGMNGQAQNTYRAHEFHYATTLRKSGKPLFHASDAFGEGGREIGLVSGSVSGSFAHIIDIS